MPSACFRFCLSDTLLALAKRVFPAFLPPTLITSSVMALGAGWHLLLLTVWGMLWGFITAASPITAQVGEDVTLSCLFPSQPGMDLQRLTLTWQKEWAGAEEIPVHSFYSGGNQLVTQAEAYRNRTQLDLKGLAQGNAALTLRGIRTQDEGIYCCYVYSELNWTSEHWELRVEAPYGEPHVTFDLSLRLGYTLLTFSLGGGYPQASVEWHDVTGTNLTELSTTTETVDAQGLYNLCSKMAVPMGQGTNLTVLLMTDGKETPIQFITLAAGPGQSHNWTWQLVACLGAMTTTLSVIMAVMLFCPPRRDLADAAQKLFHLDNGHERSFISEPAEPWFLSSSG